MSVAVAAVVSFLKMLYPVVEPMLLPLLTQVAQQLGAELLAKLKGGILTTKYPFLAGIETPLANAVAPFLDAAKIAAEVEKLAAKV